MRERWYVCIVVCSSDWQSGGTGFTPWECSTCSEHTKPVILFFNFSLKLQWHNIVFDNLFFCRSRANVVRRQPSWWLCVAATTQRLTPFCRSTLTPTAPITNHGRHYTTPSVEPTTAWPSCCWPAAHWAHRVTQPETPPFTLHRYSGTPRCVACCYDTVLICTRRGSTVHFRYTWRHARVTPRSLRCSWLSTR